MHRTDMVDDGVPGQATVVVKMSACAQRNVKPTDSRAVVPSMQMWRMPIVRVRAPMSTRCRLQQSGQQ
ncbi:hypothetical protein [Serratia inhibens]|uniref:hypothetical protein n=1 Tax=Serratia inhibens TaxID=2338073 RepID=UPI0011C3D781|nr:hypothetical protein [Serratia inhibens]